MVLELLFKNTLFRVVRKSLVQENAHYVMTLAFHVWDLSSRSYTQVNVKGNEQIHNMVL